MTGKKRCTGEPGKKLFSFLIKTGISAGLIFWLLKQDRLDFTYLTTLSFDMHTLVLITVGAISVFSGLLLLGWRLWLLLNFKRFSVTYKKALNLTFMGSFFGAVLPGLVGGDLVKAAYLCANVSERRTDALASVLIDRALGLYSLLLLGALVLCSAWILNVVPLNTSIVLVTPFLVVVLTLGIFLIAWDGFFDSQIVQMFFSLLPQKIQDFFKALRDYLRAPKLIIFVIALSLFNHALVVGSFIAAGALLKDNIPILAHFILNPLAMLMNARPLTPGGLGMAESVFSFLFDSAGSSNGAMIGLIGRCIQYVVFIMSGSIALSFLKMRSRIFTVDQENFQQTLT